MNPGLTAHAQLVAVVNSTTAHNNMATILILILLTLPTCLTQLTVLLQTTRGLELQEYECGHRCHITRKSITEIISVGSSSSTRPPPHTHTHTRGNPQEKTTLKSIGLCGTFSKIVIGFTQITRHSSTSNTKQVIKTRKYELSMSERERKNERTSKRERVRLIEPYICRSLD